MEDDNDEGNKTWNTPAYTLEIKRNIIEEKNDRINKGNKRTDNVKKQ